MGEEGCVSQPNFGLKREHRESRKKIQKEHISPRTLFPCR
jgi:hypothetical protein